MSCCPTCARASGQRHRFDEISHYPGLHTDPASAAIACTRAINPVDRIGDNVSFGTEAGLFDGIGIDSLVCGPGSIEQAHKPDEFIAASSCGLRSHARKPGTSLPRRQNETTKTNCPCPIRRTSATLGWREWVALPALGLPAIKAKVDTGARTSALHAYLIEPYRDDGRDMVRFLIHPIQNNLDFSVECHCPVLDFREVTDSGGHREMRYVIESRCRHRRTQLAD